MKTIFYGLIIICLTSCLARYYIAYTYETERQHKYIDNNVDISVDIMPLSNKYDKLKQVDSGPYLLTVAIGENLDLLNYIEIDSILLIMNNTTINLFEKYFNIYDSCLERNYSMEEKEKFIFNKKINFQHVHKDDYIVFIFDDVEIIYNDVSAFELIINVKLSYNTDNDVSKEIIYKYTRKKIHKFLYPST